MIRVIYVARNTVRTITRRPQIQAARPGGGGVGGAESLLGLFFAALFLVAPVWFVYMVWNYGWPHIYWEEIFGYSVLGIGALLVIRFIREIFAIAVFLFVLALGLFVLAMVIAAVHDFLT